MESSHLRCATIYDPELQSALFLLKFLEHFLSYGYDWARESS